MAKDKDRYFTFLVYPDGEGLPQNWKEKLESLGVPIAISPLHDKDKAEGGGYKKAHYHCIYIANNPVTADSVYRKLRRRLSSEEMECKAIARVQIVDKTVENVYLYLTHESKDAIAKRKYVYDKKDIVHLNNFDVERYISIDVETKREVLSFLISEVRSAKISNMPDLMDHLERELDNFESHLRLIEEVIKANTGYLRLWFDGNYQKYHRAPREKE